MGSPLVVGIEQMGRFSALPNIRSLCHYKACPNQKMYAYRIFREHSKSQFYHMKFLCGNCEAEGNSVSVPYLLSAISGDRCRNIFGPTDTEPRYGSGVRPCFHGRPIQQILCYQMIAIRS